MIVSESLKYYCMVKTIKSVRSREMMGAVFALGFASQAASFNQYEAYKFPVSCLPSMPQGCLRSLLGTVSTWPTSVRWPQSRHRCTQRSWASPSSRWARCVTSTSPSRSPNSLVSSWWDTAWSGCGDPIKVSQRLHLHVYYMLMSLHTLVYLLSLWWLVNIVEQIFSWGAGGDQQSRKKEYWT